MLRVEFSAASIGGFLNLWPLVRRFFEEDDGSLPDIFIENLSLEQMEAVYAQLLQQSSVDLREHTAWSPAIESAVRLSEFESPVHAHSTGQIESFRHPLFGLRVNAVELPCLTVCIDPGCISLDYRMGAEWREANVLALFELLYTIQLIAPLSLIYHADEGQNDSPNPEFAEAYKFFVFSRRSEFRPRVELASPPSIG